MSILDRLQLLVRAQTSSSSQGVDASSDPRTAPLSVPVAPSVEPSALDQIENEAVLAQADGDTVRARRLAEQAAAMEFVLTGGAFGRPSLSAQTPTPSQSPPRVGIPANPYGLHNPPVRPARLYKDHLPASGSWAEQPDAFSRFDAWVAGREQAPGLRQTPPAGSVDPLAALESRLRGEL